MKKTLVLFVIMLLAAAAAVAQGEDTMFEAGTDISWELQSAIRAADKASEIFIPEGVYYVSGSVKLRDGFTIRGAGMDKTTLVVAKDGLSSLFRVDEKKNVTFEGFTVDGQGHDAGNIIEAEDSSGITVRDVRVKDIESDRNPIAVHFLNTKDSGVYNCEFENISLKSEWGCAVRLSHGSAGVTVDRCVIKNTGRGGILCDNSSEYLVITNNKVTGSGVACEGLSIELWGKCGYSIVEDNYVDRWLSLDNAPFTALRRNTVSNKEWDRVGAIGIETVGSCNVIVTDCVVDTGVHTGLSASNTDPKEYVYWGNVLVTGCAQWGAQFQGETGWCRYQYFYNLTIENTEPRQAIYPGDAGHGFRFNDFCEHFVFENCRISNNAGFDLQTIGTVEDVRLINFTSENNEKTNRRAQRKFTSNTELAAAIFNCPDAVAVGETVKFENLSPEMSHCLWDFGEGIPSDDVSPEYKYTKPGVYNVTLVVWDENGVGGRASKTITVTE